MNIDNQTSPVSDDIVQWLMDQGLQETALDQIARGLGKRLVASGISVQRISIGGMLLHPIFGAMDIGWEAQDDTTRYDKFPRSGFKSPEFQNAPFYDSTANKIPFKRYHLEKGDTNPTFPIFEK